MVKILDLIRKWAWLIVAFCVVGFLALMYDSCNSNSEVAFYKGKYEAEMELRSAENNINLVEIERLNNIIVVKDNEIESLIETRVGRERERRELLAQVERLQAREPVQPELESEPLVINLRAQVRQLTLTVDTQEQIIHGNDKIIFSMTQKYQAQLKISDHYKGMYENEKELHRLAILRLKISDKRIKSLRLTGNVKNALVVIAGGTIAYLFLK